MAVPQLMFIKSTKAGIASEHIDAKSHKETAEQIDAFQARVKFDQIPFEFENLEEFRAELRIHVTEQSNRFHRTELGRSTLFMDKAKVRHSA